MQVDEIVPVRVAGIPCLARGTYFRDDIPGVYGGPPGDCYPDEPAEIEFELLDRNGRRAQWLDAKLTDADEEAAYEAILATRHDPVREP